MRGCSPEAAHADRISILLDNQAFFHATFEASSEARRSILLLGREFDPRTLLNPGDERPTTIGGALVALLSFLVIASRESTGRIILAYGTGVLLALGPFEHAVVTMRHLSFGFSFGAPVGMVDIARASAISIAGNLLGGVGLVTLSHAAQAKGADEE